MYFAMQAVMVEIKILYFGRVFPINGEGSAFLIETTAIHSDSQRNQAAATASLPLRATWKRNREVAMTTIVSNRRASFGMNCVQCANELIAPEWSEYQDERHILHLWRCGRCGCCFESLVFLPADAKSMKDIMTRDDIFPSLLVA